MARRDLHLRARHADGDTLNLIITIGTFIQGNRAVLGVVAPPDVSLISRDLGRERSLGRLDARVVGEFATGRSTTSHPCPTVAQPSPAVVAKRFQKISA